MSGGTPRLLTPEQHIYFVKHNKGRTQKSMAALMNKRFGLNLTEKQINTYRKNHHLNCGLTGFYPKGNVPWNKGKKWDSGGRSHETRFKPGQMPHNHRPVGSERITKDGYVEIKIAEPKTWRCKHVVVWESIHGPRPKGHKVIFADGNHRNFDPENLILVSSAELARMNQNGWIFEDGELTKTGAAIAKLKWPGRGSEAEEDSEEAEAGAAGRVLRQGHAQSLVRV